MTLASVCLHGTPHAAPVSCLSLFLLTFLCLIREEEWLITAPSAPGPHCVWLEGFGSCFWVLCANLVRTMRGVLGRFHLGALCTLSAC
jgi:hypothetical protein